LGYPKDAEFQNSEYEVHQVDPEDFRRLQAFNRQFFLNEPFWDMSKNGGLQIFVKIDLKCSTYGPEHKTERFWSIEVIGNFWELVEVSKNCIF
jgi:hypothetical protein